MQVEAPQIEWRNGQPFNVAYGDIYASTQDALAETDYVFLEQSGFKDAVSDLSRISIAETGFGTGLNFLSAWSYWRKHGQKNSSLHFLSIERYPFEKADLKRALQAWPEFSELAKLLVHAYPIRRAGFHRLIFDQGRVHLTLAFGDIQDCLRELDYEFDFWFLDGFAPSRNQEMWADHVCQQIARCSKIGAGLSTFTAAGAVRRALQANGFEVEKRPGFAGKREMLCARLREQQMGFEPYYQQARKYPAPKTVAVIGAGLAGASVAYACQQRGMQVRLFDPLGCAQATSGNPAGVAGPALSADASAFSMYYFQAWQMLKQYALNSGETDTQLWCRLSDAWHVLQDQRTQSRAERLSHEHADLDKWAELKGQRLLIHDTLLVNPRALCEYYLTQAQVTVEYQRIKQLAYSAGQWRLTAETGALKTEFDAVVIANAQAALELDQTSWIETQAVRGQLAYYESAVHTSTAIQQGTYYLTPFWQGHQVLGATYHRNDPCAELRQADHEYLEQRGVEAFGIKTNGQASKGRVGFRCCGPDRLPVVGPLVDAADFKQRYADVVHGRGGAHLPTPAYLPHAYISTGHGSRGISGTYLAAQIIVNQMLNEVLPVTESTWRAVAPQRFLMRQLRRGIA